MEPEGRQPRPETREARQETPEARPESRALRRHRVNRSWKLVKWVGKADTPFGKTCIAIGSQ